jgi:hypothetical protein
MISYILMSMGWSLNVSITPSAGFIPASLHIHVTIRTSVQTSPTSIHPLISVLIFRVVMATIRHLGDCPCPKVPFGSLHLTGTESDRKDWITLRWYDDQDFKNVVSSVWHKIYQENHKVTSAWVEHKLKGESLVPTSVNVLSTIAACDALLNVPPFP